MEFNQQLAEHMGVIVLGQVKKKVNNIPDMISPPILI